VSHEIGRSFVNRSATYLARATVHGAMCVATEIDRRETCRERVRDLPVMHRVKVNGRRETRLVKAKASEETGRQKEKVAVIEDRGKAETAARRNGRSAEIRVPGLPVACIGQCDSAELRRMSRRDKLAVGRVVPQHNQAKIPVL
jgi:hypothetical protein